MIVWSVILPLVLVVTVVAFYFWRRPQKEARLEDDPDWDLDVGDDDETDEPDEDTLQDWEEDDDWEDDEHAGAR
ncbi:MAG: hypothetical protein ACFCVE_12380 [Phycisphaerae bacterium]